MERIINASHNEGDLVADFFCGVEQLLAAAEKLRSRKDGNRTEYFATDSRNGSEPILENSQYILHAKE